MMLPSAIEYTDAVGDVTYLIKKGASSCILSLRIKLKISKNFHALNRCKDNIVSNLSFEDRLAYD
jgi:hypothetical protein